MSEQAGQSGQTPGEATGATPQSGQIKRLFVEASDLPSDQRALFLETRCGSDATLRTAVESLLAAHDHATDFLADPTIAPGAPGVRPEPPPAQPRRIGPYRLLKEIGEGGFGTVWLAEQLQPVRRQVALKVIKPGMDTKQVIARFEAERQALAIMDHPNIAKVYDAGETEQGRPYFVMELVQGVPITKLCDEQNYSVQQRLELFVQACQAVQHAHSKGVIHRDIKPTNVLAFLADDRPVVKVIDFGIAKATQQRLTEKTLFTEFRQMIGTPEYMPPEQAEMSGLDIDTRSDVYGLGVLMYELLTGVTPFDARELRSKAFVEMQRVIREVDPPTPSSRLSSLATLASVAATRATEPGKLRHALEGELDWIVMKCLEKDRVRRYETANGLASDVLRYLADEPVSAGPASAAYLTRKFVHRHRMAVSLIAAALLLAIAVTGLYIRGIRAEERRTQAALADAQAQRDEAERQRRGAEQARQATQAVNDFLTLDLLGSADPAVQQGRHLTVEEVLSTADKSVGEKFKNEPLIEAAVRSTLATTYDALGRADLGLPHARAAFEIRRKLLGPDHFDTLKAMSDLSVLLRSQGQFAEAEPLTRETMDRGRRTLGENDGSTIGWIANMGKLLEEQGRYADAEPYLRDALEKSRRVYGRDHSDTITAMNDLAALFVQQGKFTEADPLFREAMEGYRTALGPDHPSTLVAMNNLSVVLDDEGKLSEAEALQREVLSRRKRVLGNEHQYTLGSTVNLANLLVKQGKLDAAEPLLREAMDTYRRTLGPGHPSTIIAISNMGDLRERQKRLDDAELLYREALSLSQAALGSTHPQTFNQMQCLGSLLVDRGKLAEAEPLLRNALDGRRHALGDRNHLTVESVRTLAQLLELQGKKEEAAHLRATTQPKATSQPRATTQP